MTNLKLNSVYKHYKGKYYKTLFICNDASNPNSPLIIYQSLYEDEEFGKNAVWARSIAEFLEQIDNTRLRFEFVCELPNRETI